MNFSLWGTFNTIAFNILVFLLIMSHFKAVVSDPGTVPLPQTRIDFSDIHSTEPGMYALHIIILTIIMTTSCLKACEVDWTICTRCETYRPPRAHHCRICKRCIRRMDHHCPWINNCVGERNQKYFLQFLIYVGKVILCNHMLKIVIILCCRYACNICEYTNNNFLGV